MVSGTEFRGRGRRSLDFWDRYLAADGTRQCSPPAGKATAFARDDSILVLERLNPRQFGKFRDFIYEHSGIRIDEKKVTLLSNRIRRRLRAGDFADFDTYYRFLTSPAGVAELEEFLDAITTHETFFFRTQKQFDWLKQELVGELVAEQLAGKRPPTLRMWSAGCATGAEPYSMAICLAENMFRLRGWSLEIVGTDISEETLRDARQGSFAARAVEGVSEEQRRRFFRYQPDRERWQIRPEIRKLVEFKRQNLLRPCPLPGFDCIFIRNVLIYFDRALKHVVLKHLLNALSVNGYLVVGPSEGVYGMLGNLQQVSPLIYRKVGNAPPPGPVATGRGTTP